MKKIYINIVMLAIATLVGAATSAQTVSTFENITLTADTFRNGIDMSGGFASGNAFLPNHYDTSFGGFWDGAAISNKKDSVTPGYQNQYSAVTAKGYNGSSNYAVVYGSGSRVRLTGAAAGKQVNGFYITNSTYAYRAVKDGASAKKFGGSTGNDPDWFKVTINGFKNNGNPADTSIDFYLADFRSSDNSKDYIINQWTWVDLTALGNVDSIQFEFASTDTNAFGMLTPAYFCMDNFTTRDISTGIAVTGQTARSLHVYPNPATDHIIVEGNSSRLSVAIHDLAGREMLKQEVVNGDAVGVSSLPAGMYLLQVNDGGTTTVSRLVIE